MNNKEIWKDIKNYEGLYQISNFGNVKSFKRKEKELRKCKNARGYLVVSLCSNRIAKKFYVHRLVAQTFLDNPKNYCQVNHIDGNKKNNAVNNLEWVNSQENMKHAYENKLTKGRRKKVYQYDLNGNLINIYESRTKASKETNIPEPIISMCIHNKRHHKKWLFKDGK